MRPRPVIAIDGPAGAGKSTVAKKLAERLGLLYLDTGAMYRALTLKAIELGVKPEEEEKLIKLASQTRIEFDPTGRRIFMDGREVTDRIRSPEVDKVISDYVKIPGLRRVMVQKQRELGKEGGVVAEGRDIGTVVFPDADLKIYLDASPRVRAIRRWRELKAKGIEISLDEIERDIIARDLKDSTRKVAPLKPAPDAIRLDTSDMSVDQVVEEIMERCRGNG
ncbi:(d)CMP kinase [Candidatus Poribacteria bacterium]|nr:(d)CMP kinase [Candidatus Poribacteria bacterium]